MHSYGSEDEEEKESKETKGNTVSLPITQEDPSGHIQVQCNAHGYQLFRNKPYTHLLCQEYQPLCEYAENPAFFTNYRGFHGCLLLPKKNLVAGYWRDNNKFTIAVHRYPNNKKEGEKLPVFLWEDSPLYLYDFKDTFIHQQRSTIKPMALPEESEFDLLLPLFVFPKRENGYRNFALHFMGQNKSVCYYLDIPYEVSNIQCFLQKLVDPHFLLLGVHDLYSSKDKLASQLYCIPLSHTKLQRLDFNKVPHEGIYRASRDNFGNKFPVDAFPGCNIVIANGIKYSPDWDLGILEPIEREPQYRTKVKSLGIYNGNVVSCGLNRVDQTLTIYTYKKDDKIQRATATVPIPIPNHLRNLPPHLDYVLLEHLNYFYDPQRNQLAIVTEQNQQGEKKDTPVYAAHFVSLPSYTPAEKIDAALNPLLLRPLIALVKQYYGDMYHVDPPTDADKHAEKRAAINSKIEKALNNLDDQKAKLQEQLPKPTLGQKKFFSEKKETEHTKALRSTLDLIQQERKVLSYLQILLNDPRGLPFAACIHFLEEKYLTTRTPLPIVKLIEDWRRELLGPTVPYQGAGPGARR